VIPLYDFYCDTDGEVFETIASRETKTIPCAICGGATRRLISAPAKTATLWNSGWNSGLSNNGFYSYSAGQQVSSKREEENIMTARGYVNEKDLGGDSFYDQYMNNAQADRDNLDAEAARYRGNLTKFGGDKVRAVTETWNAKDMLEQAAAHDAAKGIDT
jgi:predicted nucleic acid-binding Zn ribbon protein